MIDQSEILEAANETGLNPYVIEKDYVIGWVLAGIYDHPDIRDAWVFKGGTCLKKCFFADLSRLLGGPRFHATRSSTSG